MTDATLTLSVTPAVTQTGLPADAIVFVTPKMAGGLCAWAEAAATARKPAAMEALKGMNSRHRLLINRLRRDFPPCAEGGE